MKFHPELTVEKFGEQWNRSGYFSMEYLFLPDMGRKDVLAQIMGVGFYRKML